MTVKTSPNYDEFVLALHDYDKIKVLIDKIEKNLLVRRLEQWN